MPFLPGRAKTGGAKKGSHHHDRRTVAERLKEMGVDPFKILGSIAHGDLDCGVCRGKGTTKFQAGDIKLGERKCQSCYGSGKERISPAERNRASSELAKYMEPQLKAIEVSGRDGGPVLTDIRVHFVKAENGKPAE